MRQIVFTIHFRGQAAPTSADQKVLRATSSGTSCTVRTVISSAGLMSEIKPTDGDLAFFESEVKITGTNSFEESGTITFGDETEHEIRFSSVGAGHIEPAGQQGSMAGTVSWQVTGGAGQFAGARGFITSTFTLSESGDLSDYQTGLIFLAE